MRFRKTKFAVLLLAWFCGFCCVDLMGATVGNWDSVRKELEQTSSDTGRKEVAKKVGAEYLIDNSDKLGVATQGIVYLTNAGDATLLGRFNGALGKLGGALIFFQFADDLKHKKSTFDTFNNLTKNSTFFALGLANVPILNIVMWGSQALKLGGDWFAALAFTADAEVWWPLYEDFFRSENGPGKLLPDGWVALFNGGNLGQYEKHMDQFFTLDGKDFVLQQRGSYSRRGLEFPEIPEPTSAGVRKHAEAFRIRYFRTHLLQQLGGWAAKQAQQLIDQELESLRSELVRVVQESIIRVKVQDGSDGTAIRGAYVQVQWNDGKNVKESFGKTDEDGLVDLKEVPPWAEGPLTIEKAGHAFRKEENISDFFSTKDAPKEVLIDLNAIGVTLKAMVVDADTGKPIPGAMISAVMDEGGAKTTGVSAGDGAATLALRKIGDAVFTVSAEGYATFEGTRRVDAVSEKGPPNELFRLSPEGGVAVGVLARDTKDSKPLSGVTITCTMDDQILTKTTGADGRAKIVFPKGSAKSVSLRLTHSGYAPKTMTLGVDQGKVQAVADLEPGAGKVIVVVKEGKSGEPIPGAKIEVSPGNGKGTTGKGGSVEIDVPAAEEVAVTCTKKGLPPTKATAEMKDGIARVTILLNAEMAILKVAVGNKQTKDPLEGVKVKATVDGVETSGETDENGRLELAIPLGKTVMVILSKRGFQAVEVKKRVVDGKASVGGTLAPDGLATLAVTLKDRSTGTLLKGVKVNGGGKSAISGSDGVARLEAAAGQDVMISASLKGYEVRSGTGKAPQAGEVKKIGWFLDPVTSGKPEPKLPPKVSPKAEGWTTTLTVKDMSMTCTISGVEVKQGRDETHGDSGKSNTEVSQEKGLNGVITGSNIRISGTISYTLTDLDSCFSMVGFLQPGGRSEGEVRLERTGRFETAYNNPLSSSGPYLVFDSKKRPFTYSQPFDLLLPVKAEEDRSVYVKIYVDCNIARRNLGRDRKREPHVRLYGGFETTLKRRSNGK